VTSPTVIATNFCLSLIGVLAVTLDTRWLGLVITRREWALLVTTTGERPIFEVVPCFTAVTDVTYGYELIGLESSTKFYFSSYICFSP